MGSYNMLGNSMFLLSSPLVLVSTCAIALALVNPKFMLIVTDGFLPNSLNRGHSPWKNSLTLEFQRSSSCLHAVSIA
jgi:hypothetical protein